MFEGGPAVGWPPAAPPAKSVTHGRRVLRIPAAAATAGNGNSF